MSLRTKLTTLLNKANNKTGKQDTTLSNAVQTLIDGYGKGNTDAPLYDGEYIITDDGEIIYVTRDLDLSTFNLNNYYGNRLAFTEGVYSKGDTIDFTIPKEAFDFGDDKWCIQFRFAKQVSGRYTNPTVLGVKGSNDGKQVWIEYVDMNAIVNVYLNFPSSTGDNKTTNIFSSKYNSAYKFYTVKIEYDGTNVYTTTLFDEDWNIIQKDTYETDEKVVYSGKEEILGGLYDSSESMYTFVGDYDLKNSYIVHGDKVVWGIKEKGTVVSDNDKVLSGAYFEIPITFIAPTIYTSTEWEVE